MKTIAPGIEVTRRKFIAASTFLLAGAVAGCGGGGGGGGGKQSAQSNGVTVFKLSGRGRRVSQAAKKHNANTLFRTRKLADKHRAHPGDHSRIVAITISETQFDTLFKIPKLKIVDLRHKV